MTPAGIIDALHKAGATLVIEDGRTRVRGSKVPDELLAALRDNKDAVLAEWQRRQESNRDRYAVVPDNAPMMESRDVALPPARRESVVAHALRQPRPVHAWIQSRTAEYHALGFAFGEDEVCACLDLLCWQRNTHAREALDWLEGLDEAYATRPQEIKNKQES